jgi:hypothetical protein
MKRLIIFLVRKRLGLKQREGFRFTNQKSKANYYWFENGHLWKADVDDRKYYESHVSLNYILSDECHIEKV